MRQSLIFALPLGLLMAALGGSAAAQAEPTCLAAIAANERKYDLPPGLLLAVALAESGRSDPESGLTTPWAWTVTQGGSGQVFASGDEALRAAAQALGQSNALIDVGCMQVDLYHHPTAFASLRRAFDPDANVDYAAQFLRQLYRSQGSWTAAIAAYHTGAAGGADPGAAYLARVLYVWKSAKIRPEKGATPHPGFLVEESPPALDLAARYFVERDIESALAIYNAVLLAHPDDKVALQGAAECLDAKGRREDARALLLRALADNPADPLIVERYLHLTAPEETAQRLAHLIVARDLAPQAARLQAEIALIEAGNGQDAAAALSMAAALRLAPDDLIILLDYALLLDRQGDWETAGRAYQSFLARYRPDGVALPLPLPAIRERSHYLTEHRYRQ